MKPALSYFMIQIAKHLSSIYILIESGSDYEGKRIVEVQKTQSQRQWFTIRAIILRTVCNIPIDVFPRYGAARLPPVIRNF